MLPSQVLQKTCHDPPYRFLKRSRHPLTPRAHSAGKKYPGEKEVCRTHEPGKHKISMDLCAQATWGPVFPCLRGVLGSEERTGMRVTVPSHGPDVGMELEDTTVPFLFCIISAFPFCLLHLELCPPRPSFLFSCMLYPDSSL